MRGFVDELRLKESYLFNVIVENNGSRFSGKLSLTPNVCTLTVAGDVSEDRQPDLNVGKIDELFCDAAGAKFALFGLVCKGFFKGAIQHSPNSIWHFEITYDISHVIYSRTSLRSGTQFVEIELDSPSISRWVGDTHTQQAIVEKYHDGTLFMDKSDPSSEFEQTISNLGMLRMNYNTSIHFSNETFSAGLQFPPTVSLFFDVSINSKEVINFAQEMNTLFSFLLGSDIDLEAIKLTSLNDRRTLRPSLYFPHTAARSDERHYALFPLGKDLRFDQLNLPRFPLESFESYFCLATKEILFFKKYLKYRELENPEERFLGYFRLLEKLCYRRETFVPEEKLAKLIDRATPFITRHFGDKKNVTRLLDRLTYANTLKFNTESCIITFIKKLPKPLTDRWIYGKSEIGKICKLRNNLTHANELESDELEMETAAKFIETLLVICLFEKIGVPVDASAKIVPRLKLYHLIVKPVKPPTINT